MIWIESKKAFEILKRKITTTPLLRHPDCTKPFVIIPRANPWAACAVLRQEHEGIIQPVRLTGKVLEDHVDIKDRDFVVEWLFDVTEHESVAQAETQRNGEKHPVTPVDFMVLLLQNLKDLDEDFMDEKLGHVVIKKPAHTSDKCTELLDAAAKDAGVNVLTYLSECLAAAITYILDEVVNSDKPEDCWILEQYFEVMADKGKDTLGGENFTTAVYDHCAKSFLRKTKLDIKTNQKRKPSSN
ncbi:Heat shock protein70 [Phytophthora megakarya]|uniref:Heat shock protein70 n=1 Tax=Phytophthora megakarya TaxID=4795 RepID=A0A225WJT7_9STRA|nr:Heat shock protein70 [Phytophthora megakarya]